MDKRTLLAIVLSLAVIFIYQTYFAPPPTPRQAPSVAEETPGQPAPPGAVAPPAVGGEALRVAKPQKQVQEQEINVDTPLFTAVFSTRGAALKSFRLKKYNQTLDPASGLVELVATRDLMPLPLTLAFPDSTFAVPADGTYEVDLTELKLGADSGRQQLTFRQVFPRQMKVEKIYSFYPDQYLFTLEVRVHNLSEQTLSQNMGLTWSQFVDPTAPVDGYSHFGPISFISDSVERHVLEPGTKQNVIGPNVTWGAFESKYFIAALIPQNPILTSLVLEKDARNVVSVGLRGPQKIIPVGQVAVVDYSFYMGPKDFEILQAKGLGLENSIDFTEWLRWLVVPLLMLLKFFYEYVHNYGVAIIILTILIKIIFWPLGNKSYRSMKDMQKLQPKIMELRERYKDDKTRLSQETMALYRNNKVNPLGGCLPMILQIPVFFGLYKTLLYAIELRHSPFIWWIQDLSAMDPYYITPVIMGATMFLQQKMAPPMGDPLQAKIMLFMPVIFTVLFLTFPSGLVLYWLFNNVISIAQQLHVNRKYN